MGGVSSREPPTTRRSWRKGYKRKDAEGKRSEVHTCDRAKFHRQRTLIPSFLPFLGEGLQRGRSYKNNKNQTRFVPNTQTKGGQSSTELFKSVEKHGCNADEGECAEEIVKLSPGWPVGVRGP